MASFIQVTPVPGSIETMYINMDKVRSITPRNGRLVIEFSMHDNIEVMDTIEEINKKLILASREVIVEVGM